VESQALRVLSPSACTSLMKSSNAAALTASDDAEFGSLLDRVGGVSRHWQAPTTFAFDDCACSRTRRKSEVFSGCLTARAPCRHLP